MAGEAAKERRRLVFVAHVRVKIACPELQEGIRLKMLKESATILRNRQQFVLHISQ